MRKFARPAVLAMAMLSLASPRAAAQEAVDAGRLLGEMADLSALAEFPEPAFTTGQASSYDRQSTAPDAPHWFANADRGQYLRAEERPGGTEHVMMDAKGPGAVVRIWSANPNGVLRVYLDGSDVPAVEADMADLLGGKVAGVPEPIAGVRARGYNLFLPIPYAESCKVTHTEGGSYYLVNYRTYAPGTDVKTFGRDDLAALRPAIEAAATAIGDPRGAGVEPEQTHPFDVTLAPGEASPPLRLQGPAAITRMIVRLTSEGQGAEGPGAEGPGAEGQDAEGQDADRLAAARRGAVLRMSFDGEETVEVPLADFFVAAGAARPFAALPLGVGDDGEMRSRWVMPFEQGAAVTVENRGRAPVRLRGEVGTVARPWTDRSMHFHADYVSRYDLDTRPETDLTHLDAAGRGAFVGLSMAIDNPTRGWWGEGDEKVYVDGEAFPSWFGTGTEDYFGYAWCDPTPFAHAYHAQPQADGPGNYGRTSNARFHVTDRIPFTDSLRFDMELLHWEDVDVNVATVAYWYGRPGATSATGPVSADDLAVRPLPPYQPMRVAGAVEGEEMTVLSDVGQAGPQDLADLSGDRQLWWRGAGPGDVLALRFDAPGAGRFRVLGRFVKARDYGTVRLTINGRPAGDGPIDFYGPGVAPTGEVDLGTFDLRPEGNEFSAEVVGANGEAVKAYMFGLDYLRMVPVAAGDEGDAGAEARPTTGPAAGSAAGRDGASAASPA